MNQNKLLKHIIKLAGETTNITQKDLDTFLPTGPVATLGDLIPGHRLGRRSGKATELANLAGIPEEANIAELKNPLTTDMVTSRLLGGLSGALLGAGIGAAGAKYEDLSNKKIKGHATIGALFGGAAGAILGPIISRIRRNRRIRKIKKLIAQKGKINVPELKNGLLNDRGLLNIGGVPYDTGRMYSKQYVKGLSYGLPNKALNKLIEYPKTDFLVEHGGNIFIPGLGSVLANMNDRGRLNNFNKDVKLRLN